MYSFYYFACISFISEREDALGVKQDLEKKNLFDYLKIKYF